MQAHSSRPIAPCPMEHRWGERVTIDCAAFLLLPDGTSAAGRLRNASISGALIDTGVRLPACATLTVILAAAQAPRRRTIELPACVVRIARGGIAVEWREMAVGTLVALLREAGGNMP